MPYKGPIIDVDIHHTWASPEELFPYLDPRARELVAPGDGGGIGIDPAIPMYPHSNGVVLRVDAFSEDGRLPGSDLETLRRQHLDPFEVEAGILTFGIGLNAGVPNPRLGTALAKAANRWSIERWLESGEERLFGAVLVPTQLPEDGAAEIREVGRHERIAGALLVANGLGRSFGHPIYDPIFAAAAEMNLPLLMHSGGDQLPGGTHHIAGGMPLGRMEFTTLGTQSAAMHLASLIVHGVFERYPDLRYIVVESGVAWLAPFAWRLDQVVDELRLESDWIRKLPSEYLREHVRISTQPIELSPERQQLIDVLEGFEGIEDVLVFASDYPHWDADAPSWLARRLPDEWGQKVLHDNAAQVLRLPTGVAA
jgi:predicted TIM-barrel fold metal-dependent hydrolase